MAIKAKLVFEENRMHHVFLLRSTVSYFPHIVIPAIAPMMRRRSRPGDCRPRCRGLDNADRMTRSSPPSPFQPTAFASAAAVGGSRGSFAGHVCSTRLEGRVFPPCKQPSVRFLWHCLAAESGTATGTKSSEAAALAALQNGSDVRGVAEPLLGGVVNLTPGRVRAIVASFARDTSEKLGRKVRIAIGRDSRISGPALEEAAAAGVLDAGMEPTLFGLATTPAMFMATVIGDAPFDAALMLTASHLPPDRNGIKFFTREGSANKADIKRILAGAAGVKSGEIDGDIVRSRAGTQHFMKDYAAHLVRLIKEGCNHPDKYEKPLTELKIVVDAGNGAAGFFASEVLEELGADVYGQFLEPDGMFPNHIPNPEDATAMAMTVDSTVREGANLGVIFDTDGDRSGFVDDRGTAINRNRLIAILARIVLNQAPGSTIVTDSVTSNGLKRFIEQNGGKHFRYRKGYKNVIDKGIELNSAGIETLLAIETSGHGAMRENYMLDDGAYLAVKIIIELVRLRLSGDTRGIGGLLDGLEEPLEEIEFRLPFKDNSKYQEYGTSVLEAFAQFASTVDGWTPEEENYEGLRVNVREPDGKAGWLLLRRSLHDPLLPLNIESETKGGIAAISKVLVDRFFKDWPNIDATALSERINERQE